MKSIRTKITMCLILTVLIALVASGISSIIPNYHSTISTVDHMMSETAVLAAERVEQELTAYKNVAMDTGCIPQLTDPSVALDEKRSVIDERCAMHNFQRGNIIGLDGISIFDGKDYSDREYVKQAMQGNVYVSEPLISKITGELSIMVAAPLYENGIHGSSIAGVVYFVPQETFLNDIVSSIQVGENSRAYMINKSGDTIADITLETITVQNIETEAQSDPSGGNPQRNAPGRKRVWKLQRRRAKYVCGLCAGEGYGRLEHSRYRTPAELSVHYIFRHGD